MDSEHAVGYSLYSGALQIKSMYCTVFMDICDILNEK